MPITAGTAEIILSWQLHRASLRVPPALDRWLFPSPLLRARQSRGHITPSCVARGFKAWTGQIGVIDSELPGPGGTPAPFDPSLITPYALRHSYAQRHADAGVSAYELACRARYGLTCRGRQAARLCSWLEGRANQSYGHLLPATGDPGSKRRAWSGLVASAWAI